MNSKLFNKKEKESIHIEFQQALNHQLLNYIHHLMHKEKDIEWEKLYLDTLMQLEVEGAYEVQKYFNIN